MSVLTLFYQELVPEDELDPPEPAITTVLKSVSLVIIISAGTQSCSLYAAMAPW